MNIVFVKVEYKRGPSFIINLKTRFPFREQGMKYTQTTLDKIEKIAEEMGYIVRYERGSFQSGFCILEEKKVVVLNKFLPLEGRINTMIDLIPQLKIDAEALTPDSSKWYDDIMGRYHASNKEESKEDNSSV